MLMHELLPAARALQSAPGQVEKVQRAMAARCKYTEDDKKRWRDMAAQPDLSLHGKRRAASLIAMREGLPTEATETIRKVL
ncbi:hypothetical protein D9M72_579770 [compost metagenome]